MKETHYVCDYIMNGGDKEEFLAKFDECACRGLRPGRDLLTDRHGQPDHHAQGGDGGDREALGVDDDEEVRPAN